MRASELRAQPGVATRLLAGVAEILGVTTILHDVGLSEVFDGPS